VQRLIMDEVAKHKGETEVLDRVGCCLLLAPGFYDLRLISKKIRDQLGMGFAENAWQASFSRAVRGLERRGAIRFLWLVPIIGVAKEYGGKGRVEELSDGTYWSYHSKERRFFSATT